MRNGKLLGLASLMASSHNYSNGSNNSSLSKKFASKGKKRRQMYRHKLHK